MNLLRFLAVTLISLTSLVSFAGSKSSTFKKACVYNFSEDYWIEVDVYRDSLGNASAKRIWEFYCLGEACRSRVSGDRFRYQEDSNTLLTQEGTVLKLQCHSGAGH